MTDEIIGATPLALRAKQSRLTAPVLLTLALILLCSAFIQGTTIRETVVIAPDRADAAAYVSYAYNLRENGVYSRMNTRTGNAHGVLHADGVSPPGYPLFLTLFMRGKPNLQFMERVILAQAALGVFSTFFAFLLARFALPPALACVVALLTALSPHLAIVSAYLLSESLFTCLLLISLWTFAQAIKSRRSWDWALAGLIFGVCCLVRPTLQAIGLVFALSALAPRMRAHRRSLAIALLCWGILVGPWLVYQQNVNASSGQPEELRASLYHGSFPDFMYNDEKRTYGFAYQYDPQANRIMASYRDMATVLGGRMAQQPLRYLRWYLLGKPGYFLSWGIVAGMGDIYIFPVATSPFLARPAFKAIRALMFALHWPLMLLGLTGSIIALWRPGWLRLSPSRTMVVRLLGLLALLAIALHMLGSSYPRYGIPFRPLFYLLAVVMARALWLSLRGNTDAKRQLSSPK